MNRSDFFKKLGLGVLAVAVAPKLIAEVKEEPKLIIQPSPHGKFQWEEPNYPTAHDIVTAWEQRGDKLWLPYDEGICIHDVVSCGGL